jgi:uncharacterized protein DUF4383
VYESKTVAQIYTLTLGLLLLAIGIAGFVAEAVNEVGGSSFGDAENVTIFRLDLWHSGLHTLAGLLALATWRRADSARIYAIAIGCFYLVIAAWGLLGFATDFEQHVFGLMQVRLADDITHAVIGLASVLVGYFSRRHGLYRPGRAEFA